MANILQFPREQLVWIDEMGSDRRNAMCYVLLGVILLFIAAPKLGANVYQ